MITASIYFMIVFRSENDNIVQYDYENADEITDEMKIQFSIEIKLKIK